MGKDVDDLCIYARDLDGTGSMHICSKGDPGAVWFIREDVVAEMVADQKRHLDMAWDSLTNAERVYQAKYEQRTQGGHVVTDDDIDLCLWMGATWATW